MRALLLFAGLGLAASLASAFPPEGKYREEIRNPFRGQSYTLVKTLHLRIGGKAELFFEYKGEKPIVDLLVKDEYGGLMDVVSNFRKLKHSGTWRPTGGRIYVELTDLEAGDERARLHSAFEFELFSNELVARKQDTGDYGDQTIRMKLLEAYNVEPVPGNPGPTPIPAPGGDPFDPSRRKGNYAWAESVPGQDGESLYVRRLKLNGDRSAELISEYLGSRPRLTDESRGRYGSLFPEVIANRKITHRGAWRESDGRVRVELDRIGGGDFAQNVHSIFILEPVGNELVVREQDQGDYGNRESRLRKDFSPSAPSRPLPIPGPGVPNRPDPVPNLPSVTELDQQVSGGGFAAYSGRQAQELSQLRVVLRKDGKFEVRLKGRDDFDIRGRYELRKNGDVILSVTDAFGSSSSGAGTLSLDRRNAVRKLVVRGDANGHRFTVTFDVR